MRLIDVDNFKKFLHNLQDAGAEHVDFDDLHKFLDEQPTTYDVDKVVENLEEVKNKDTEIALDEAQKERCFWYAQGMNRAIEIVKGGGVDE